ncbi:glutamate synthase (NADPH/NADH) small chain [Ereboglobus sp. PH5-10]|uniref:glutamate synthase subunit beta n=1 Tax=Ereboglobus sp. PH5-10 TaxID=2940629 RepID=UPI0024061B92|nr:glutamate synthase subunit beta [Ereboglobus sp. PH5-10]MDF9826834.1 glutamate synthase (NADPH/NADH) small chain [Ereboglobus sp. PH5-10]
MGKPTGFLEYMREIPTDRPPLDRLRDWNEFHHKLDEEKLRRQGARCMDCGVPFCHTGKLISGMAAGCPVHNLIPEFNDLVFRGLWREAYARLDKTNNFPEFTGRVCPAPCEGSCVLGINRPPVAIKNNECSISERAWGEGWVVPRPPKFRTGKKVAVVGSGPAGLAAAAQLNRAGHAVTVFERADRPGGLLMYGIPNMKLDKRDVVLRRIRNMEAEGVTFVCNAEIGGGSVSDIEPDELLATHDAIVLCIGATQPRDLPVEGRNLDGVHFAVDFLTENTKAVLSGNKTAPAISAAGKHVIVIGGGDTGTDCVGTSLRQGCASVRQIEIMPESPRARQPGNPWPEWPKVLKTDYGQEEAAARQGADPRAYLTTVKKFIGEKSVRELVAVEVKWEKNQNGQFIPREQPGTEKTLKADLVLLAMGFLGPEQSLPGQLKLETDARGNIKAAHEIHRTNHPKVFAAGDCRRGQSLVVWAINEGRAAARECDRALMGSTLLP